MVLLDGRILKHLHSLDQSDVKIIDETLINLALNQLKSEKNNSLSGPEGGCIKRLFRGILFGERQKTDALEEMNHKLSVSKYP